MKNTHFVVDVIQTHFDSKYIFFENLSNPSIHPSLITLTFNHHIIQCSGKIYLTNRVRVIVFGTNFGNTEKKTTNPFILTFFSGHRTATLREEEGNRDSSSMSENISHFGFLFLKIFCLKSNIGSSCFVFFFYPPIAYILNVWKRISDRIASVENSLENETWWSLKCNKSLSYFFSYFSILFWFYFNSILSSSESNSLFDGFLSQNRLN